jgi:hypothetical protein
MAAFGRRALLGASVGVDATGGTLRESPREGSAKNPLLSGTDNTFRRTREARYTYEAVEIENASFQFDQDSVHIKDLQMSLASTHLHERTLREELRAPSSTSTSPQTC